MAFSPDGHRIPSGAGDGTVQIWDADTARAVGAPMTGHKDGPTNVAFSPDGHHVVSGGSDGTVRLWHADTRRPVGEPLTGHEGFVNSVAFGSDGHLIASGGCDGTVRLWTGPIAWGDALCSKLAQNMSIEQWREWVSPDIDYLKACPGLPIPPDGSPAASNSR